MLHEPFVCLFVYAVFVTCSCFDCRAVSRKGGTGNELVAMVKDGTVCGNVTNKVTTYTC